MHMSVLETDSWNTASVEEVGFCEDTGFFLVMADTMICGTNRNMSLLSDGTNLNMRIPYTIVPLGVQRRDVRVTLEEIEG